MDEREQQLGFKPQKEVPYNKFLPYAEIIDEESLELFSQIKANLVRAIQFRDIKIGTCHWTGQLTKYIRLYGMKFSKEDHLALIHLIYELIEIPDLDYSLIQKFAQLLITLLKKWELLTREDLVLEWRPLYKLMESVSYSSYEHHGLVLLPANVENVLKNLIKVSRIYFRADATQEMLDEWRPLLCPFDVTMAKGMYFFDMFLPTRLLEHEHELGYKLWFDEMIAIWDTCQNSPSWEVHLVNLFARLSYDAMSYIDWSPYVPKIFTRILRSFNLPVGAGQVHVGRNGNNYEIGHTVLWIVAMMGGESNIIQEHLGKMLKALESFFHPSNFGKWTPKLMKCTSRLCQVFVRRLHRERHKKTWALDVPEYYKLTEVQVTEFVNSMTPMVLLSMFSKVGPSEAAQTFQKLAVLRPEIVIPPLLERTYPALEALIEPHRLTSCLHCLVSVCRPMLSCTKYYPEGRTHVLPLLNLCLPGIDHNDYKKTLVTFQLISTLVSLVPIVDCSEAVNLRSDLTDIERELCLATAQFEDFVLQFMDRVFTLIENSAQDSTRSESGRHTQLNHQEVAVEVALLSTFSALMNQSSAAIYNEALQRLHRFVTTNVNEVHIAGRFTADLLRGAFKVNPQKSLQLFVPHFCNILITRCSSEDISNAEHLDHEFLWNLKLLSESVRCDGRYLVSFKNDIMTVLQHTLHLRCKEGSNLAGSLLRHSLRAFTLSYALDYKSSPSDWNAPFDTQLPIREWGIKGDLDNLDMKWHTPNNEEKQAAEQFLSKFLLRELERIKQHREGIIMDREELNQCLEIVMHCIMGAGNLLPVWTDESVQLVESLVELKRFGHPASLDESGISLEGQNVRTLVLGSLRPLLDKMLESNADDTKSMQHIVKIYGTLMFYFGSSKEDFENRWKSLHIVKKSMENKLIGKKSHMRALLVDRIQLQHELRVVNRAPKILTVVHRDLFKDLYRLSVSRYGEVRKTAQHYLSKAMHIYAYSYRCLLDDLLVNLKDQSDIQHHQHKGALYLILGENKRSFTTKRSWEIMLKVWPCLVSAKHSEKPSILKLMDQIMDKLHKNIETTEISIIVPESAIAKTKELMGTGSKPAPTLQELTAEEMNIGLEKQNQRNADNLRDYNALINKLVELAESGNLSWKFHQIALEMVGLLTRHDTVFPASAVRLFVNNMIHDTLQIRKISLGAISAVLKAQKRKHPTIDFDPLSNSNTEFPSKAIDIHPGDREDNTWHHYTEDVLDTAEKWQNTTFVEKTHWGYYMWPKKLKVYAPVQPKLGRSIEELDTEERVVYDGFNNPEYLSKLLDFLMLEEDKGHDKFHSKYFTIFKGLFRNFDTAFLPVFRTHLERLVADTAHDKREYSHRLAAEIISGLIRGSKHWDFERVRDMWEWLTPVIKTGLANMSVECVVDWGTAFATASESRDPRKLHFMLELLMDNPLSGEGGSFGDESRLYVLQGAIAQQEWRVPMLLHKLLDYIAPHLDHPYKMVRDRLGSTLVNIFMYDVSMPGGVETKSPHRDKFLEQILPQLEILKETRQAVMSSGNGGSSNGLPGTVAAAAAQKKPEDTAMEVDQKLDDVSKAAAGDDGENGESEEHKTAVKLCKTVMKWLLGSFSRNYTSLSKDVFNLLPIAIPKGNLGGIRYLVSIGLAVVKAKCISYIITKSYRKLCVIQNETEDEDLIELRGEAWRELYEVQANTELLKSLVDYIGQFCAIQSETKDQDFKRDSMISLAIMAHSPLRPHIVGSVLQVIEQVSEMSSWHARGAILNYLQVTVFCNFFLMLDPALVAQVKRIVVRLLQDEQLEVREMAAVTLGGFLHCAYLELDKEMLTEFQALSRTKLKKKAAQDPEKLLKRHAGVLGLCACVQAFPYDVPEFIPQILMDISDHLNDPQTIQVTVKKTLSNFKRTHYDNWQDHKQKFTDDQLVVLTDLLVSPSYYA